MREYHAIIAYLQKEQQTTKKPPQWEQVKEKILYGVKEIQDIRTIEHEYEKEIVGKIYSHWTD